MSVTVWGAVTLPLLTKWFVVTHDVDETQGMSPYRPLEPLRQHLYTRSITSLSFDPVSDTLWTGSSIGQVVAYHGKHGVQGVSYPVGGHAPVKKIIAEDSYVRAAGVSGEGLGTWNKGGVNKWYFRQPTGIMEFSNTSSSSPLVAVSTNNGELVLLNSLTGDVVRHISSPSTANHLYFSHSALISGSLDGFLRTHDQRSGMRREEGADHIVKAHHGGIEGLQCSGNLVFTIGLGMRQSRPVPDPLVKVYDLRTLRSLPPVPFQAGPAFICVVPNRPSSLAITSKQGLINIVDVMNPNIASEFYQLDVDLSTYVTAAAVSPTGAYLAFGDAAGAIHFWTAAETDDLPLNGFDGQPIEWADPPEPLPDIEWSDSTPLNSIGLPYYNTPLLSSWSRKLQTIPVQHPPPQRIPPQVLNTMKALNGMAYASLPKELKGRRNVVVAAQSQHGRFRSGKSRGSQSEAESPVYDPSGDAIPKMYRRVEIEYSKFGVEDFDFGFFNKTDYSGLETHILHSYANPLIQVMHYIEPIRQLGKSHITTNCQREDCLLCELGFVVRMLEDAHGTNCQASNFCKTLGMLAQAANAIELIDYGRDSNEIDYAHKIQSFHRFLIDHLSSEGNNFPHNPSLIRQASFVSSPLTPTAAPITQLLGIDAKNVITCMSCKAVREKENMSHIVDMVYPRKMSNEPPPSADFASVMRSSLIRYMTHKATCQTCKQFAAFSSRRSIATKDLPAVLAVNTCISNEENIKLWLDSRNETFLKPRIELRGQLGAEEDPECTTYELRAVVAQIVAKDRSNHLVAIIRVPEAERRKDLNSPWFLFNDFLVRNISESEALSFPEKWKLPSIVYLERVDVRDRFDFSGLPMEIDSSILCRDTSISLNRDKNLIKHECLRFEELPKPGTLVAIDAEFVQMQLEESEFRSDGTKKVLRPPRRSLARVSVLRGSGPKEGTPFIDDHIHTSEAIVDYLTKHSGVKLGDLDPRYSPYTLTPLKLVYKKLRVLVDRGCIFIGHGLSSDFRIINIFVPPEQVIDTVDLYFLRNRQRRLSLRFLSWFVLHENIQTDVHDSIEDAHSALKLYKAYHEFEEQGTFDQKLEELYREGRQYGWKPPESAASPIPAPAATSSPAGDFAFNNPANAFQAALFQSFYPNSGISRSSTPNLQFFSPPNPSAYSLHSPQWKNK